MCDDFIFVFMVYEYVRCNNRELNDVDFLCKYKGKCIFNKKFVS